MKLFFKEKQNFLTKENKKFIEQVIYGKNFPVFFQEGTTLNDRPKDIMFCHVVLKRLEQTQNLKDAINTDDVVYTNTLDILNNFCKLLNYYQLLLHHHIFFYYFYNMILLFLKQSS